MRKISRTSGFSMVEVAVAVGIVAFCLIAVIGLLPVGLNAVKASTDEANAVNLLEQISESIRKASLEPSTTNTYAARGVCQGMNWALGAGEFSTTLPNISTSGVGSTDDRERRYTARVRLIPPADKTSTGKALISVAWPVHATWDQTKSQWQRNEGAVETWIVFLPEEP